MLSITPGDAAAGQLRRAGLADLVLPWRDLLHEGPVPAGLGLDALTAVRAGYLEEQGWAPSGRAAADLAERDRTLRAAASGPEPIALWFDANLVNQLACVQVLTVLGELRPDLRGVTLTGPASFGGVPDGELHRLHAERAELTPAQLEQASATWAAFRDDDPRGLAASVTGSALPWLPAALRRHLQQFPDRSGGLARSERRALEAIAAGAVGFAEIYAAATADDDPRFLGDIVLHAHLARLGHGPRPLLRGSRLTDEGRDVLAGRADQVALNGVRHWLGGVRLGTGIDWRWDEVRGGVFG